MIAEIKPTEIQARYRKAADDYQNIVDKINIAWQKAGYTGDPVFELFTAAARMSMLSQAPDTRRGSPGGSR